MLCDTSLCANCSKKMVCCICGKQLCFVGKRGEQEAVGHYSFGGRFACMNCNGHTVSAVEKKNT